MQGIPYQTRPRPPLSPQVLLPGSAYRFRSPASPAVENPCTSITLHYQPPPTARPTSPAPDTRQVPPPPPRDEVGAPPTPSLDWALRGRHAADEGPTRPHRLLGCHRLPTLRSKLPEDPGPSSHQSLPGATQASPITVREGRPLPLQAPPPSRVTPSASNKLWKLHIFACPLRGGAGSN